MREESEKQVVHRIEAFSDIVIGFSLAQLALNLTIPPHARDLFANVHGSTGLIALVITFALVCSVWWHHHRLFRHLFVPTRSAIFANFAALCGVILLAYSMQLLVHAHLEDTVAFAMYTGSYAWITAFFAFIAWNGVRLRGSMMNAELRASSIRDAMRASLVCFWMIVFTAVAVVYGQHAEAILWVCGGFFASLAALRVIARRRQLAFCL